MRSGLWSAVLVSVLAVGGLSHVPAVEAAPPVPVVVQAAEPAGLPLVLAQDSGQSSSSGRTRIPRGVVRLAIFGVIMAVGAVGWVIKKVSGAA